MAKVIAKVVGGSPKEMEATTVGNLKTQMGLTNHTATVNGEPENDTYELSDYEFVDFAVAAKGA